MTVLAQIWTTFLLSNITPVTHKSDLPMEHAYIIYCILRGYTVDVAQIISERMHKVVVAERKALLVFPSLINELCKYHGVQVPGLNSAEINLPINEKYIETNCKEGGRRGTQPEQQQAASPPPQAPSQLDAVIEELRQIRTELGSVQSKQDQILTRLDQIQLEQREVRSYVRLLSRQERACYTATTIHHRDVRNAAVHQGSQPYAWPSYEEYLDATGWPGDRHTFTEGERADADFGAGAGATTSGATGHDLGLGDYMSEDDEDIED